VQKRAFSVPSCKHKLTQIQKGRAKEGRSKKKSVEYEFSHDHARLFLSKDKWFLQIGPANALPNP
jgi:hypothetical protein